MSLTVPPKEVEGEYMGGFMSVITSLKFYEEFEKYICKKKSTIKS